MLLLIAVFLVPLFFFGWFGATGTWPYYGRPFFFPFGFLFVALIFFLGFRLLFWGWGWGRWRGGYYGGYHGYYRGDSLEILNQRYARGEITKEQYDQMKRDIQQQPA